MPFGSFRWWSRAGVVGLALVATRSSTAPAPSAFDQAVFSLLVPDRMVTGTILLEARVADAHVEAVKWYVDDWAKTIPAPFSLLLDVGPLPLQKKIRAVALGPRREPLYQREAVLNPGGHGLSAEFVHPVAGQSVSGAQRVAVRVVLPSDDHVESLAVDLDTRLLPMEKHGDLYDAVAELPSSPAALVARVRTARGREAESAVLLNTRGLATSADAHVVEQMVAVTRAGKPVDDLGKKDFTVRDESGPCDVREARLVRDAPLALGFAIDTSLSLQHNRALVKTTLDRFIEQVVKSSDAAFVTAFGPVVSKVGDWTSSRDELLARLHALPEPSIAGTVLYEAIIKALYQFQGGHDARTLILITDGRDFEGDVTEEQALAYAKQAGVTIYALGLTSRNPVLRADPAAPYTYEEIPADLAVLDRFTAATGGKTYAVRKPEELPAIFQKIEMEIRTQYLVSYVSHVRARNAFHPVEIAARHGHVRTAAGFFY